MDKAITDKAIMDTAALQKISRRNIRPAYRRGYFQKIRRREFRHGDIFIHARQQAQMHE